jgi:hypothetical protein
MAGLMPGENTRTTRCQAGSPPKGKEDMIASAVEHSYRGREIRMDESGKVNHLKSHVFYRWEKLKPETLAEN